MFIKNRDFVKKLITFILVIIAVSALIFWGRRFILSNLLPIIRYFDGKIRYALRDIRENITVWKLFSFWVLSFIYGFVHAAGPGHGKTIVTAYFFNKPHKYRDAFLLAGVLSTTHIVASVALSYMFVFIISNVTPFFKIRIQEYFIAASGMAVMAIGLTLLIRKVFCLNSHKHGKKLINYSSPIIVGLLAGIIPCPATMFIMTFSLSQGMPLVGLVAVSGLSVGVFTLLSMVSLAVIRGRSGLLFCVEKKYTNGLERASIILEYASLIMIIFVGSGMVATILL